MFQDLPIFGLVYAGSKTPPFAPRVNGASSSMVPSRFEYQNLRFRYLPADLLTQVGGFAWFSYFVNIML
ncbi:MAG: hypothetical protein ABIH11_03040 [Candidatus Altiarchaeota archaeon]